MIAEAGSAHGIADVTKTLKERTDQLDAAIVDAESGAVTNARKMEALTAIKDAVPMLPRLDASKLQPRMDDLCEKLLAQNATEPLRRLVVMVMSELHQFGDASCLGGWVTRMLRLAGDQNKRIATNTKVSALHVVAELMVLHPRHLEPFSSEVFAVTGKHMKFSEANVRCSALQCLRKSMSRDVLNSKDVPGNVWKMLQRFLLDKAVLVRTSAAQALTSLVEKSKECACVNGEAMIVCCLKVLTTEEQVQVHALASESRFALAEALAQILAAISTPMPPAILERAKKKPLVTSFASAMDFLEQAAAKGPQSGPVFVPFRASLCLSAIRLTAITGVSDWATLVVVIRMLLNMLDIPPSRTRGLEDDSLAQLSKHVGAALCQLLLFAESEACLCEIIEQGFLPLLSAQFDEAARSSDARLQVMLEALCSACISLGQGLQGIEGKVLKCLLHLVGNCPNPIVQLHASYCTRIVAHNSPPQLFQLLSVLLNLATVQNAELLGASGCSNVVTEVEPLIRGLFGHCVALASLVGELFTSSLGVPHDVTSAVLGTARALLQPHHDLSVSAQRRSCAFILLEGLMCLGDDWVGQRLTTLFALWKAALGKKPVERAKVLYQESAAAGADGGVAVDWGGCHDELLSLLCALRSLYAFTLHSETLLSSLPNVHKILIVFLTNVSQLVVALPHPTSSSLRAKHRAEAPAQGRPCLTLSSQWNVPEILLMIRSTMYRTFSVMLPTHFSSRFVPLLNMLADDVTRAAPGDIPMGDLVSHFLHAEDIALDVADSQTESTKEGAATLRLAVGSLLSSASGVARFEAELPSDGFSEAAAASFFLSAPHEGPNGTDSFLTPWDVWFDPSRPLGVQSTSAEWDWRCTAISLLATIMNSNEVSEAPRAAVLLHLLKKRDTSEEASAQDKKKGVPDQTLMPSLAVMLYLREYVKVKGAKSALPTSASDQIWQFSFASLKDPVPLVRRLHVEILSLLVYIQHQIPESRLPRTILQQMSSETTSESPAMRSAVALLCGSVLRTFAWGDRCQGREVTCPYVNSVVPMLLRLAKETTMPVRLWMFHSIYLSMEACGAAFMPFLKDALRLATAHILADFFESPLVLWVLAELVKSAAAMLVAVTDDTDPPAREDNVARVVSLWDGLRHVRYARCSAGAAFATVQTEVLCISAGHAIANLSAAGLHVDEIISTVGVTLTSASGASHSSAVRAAAARCLRDFATADMVSPQDRTAMPTPSLLFEVLGKARGHEARSLEDLIRMLVRQQGLLQLSVWLQTLKEIILALKPRVEQAKTDPSDGKDEHDDGAAMASAGDDGEVHARPTLPRSATKAFTISCVHLLVEQADVADVHHFQTEACGSARKEDCLVYNLHTLIALATHVSSSEESALAELGLQLMRLIVRRFKDTRDTQAVSDVGACPTLLLQFEAQVTTCIRHNLRPQTDPGLLCLAVELLRDVVTAHACSAPQRLIALLMQQFALPIFEPDPLFCEGSSTKTFLFRLQCACDILESDAEAKAMRPHLRDLNQWIGHVLRDAAVLLSGLPLQSVKTYQPACFSLTDYKAVQPCLKVVLPSLIRGVCVLCDDRLQLAPEQSATEEVMFLSLGIVWLLLNDEQADLSMDMLRVCVQSIHKILTHMADSGVCRSVDVRYVLDLLGCVWHNVFCHPRGEKLLPELLELVHVISKSIWTRREKPSRTDTMEATWLDGFWENTEDAQRRRACVSSCAFQCVSTATHTLSNTKQVSQALDVLVWWLEESLQQFLAAFVTDGTSEAMSIPPDEQSELDPRWVHLLFLSPFPLDLVSIYPALVTKYWRQVCAILSSDADEEDTDTPSRRALFLSLVVDRLSRSLLAHLVSADLEEAERHIVCVFALLVAAATSMSSLLQRVTEDDGLAPFAQDPVERSIASLKEAFDQAFKCDRIKIVQTAVSSVSALLQTRGCSVLCPVLVPSMLLVVVAPSFSVPEAIDLCWGAVSCLVIGTADLPQETLAATTQLLLRLVVLVVEYSVQEPSTFDKQKAAMAQCLVKLAQADQLRLKSEVSALGIEEQQAVQEMLREHMSKTSADTSGDAAGPVGPAKKIELKMKF